MVKLKNEELEAFKRLKDDIFKYREYWAKKSRLADDDFFVDYGRFKLGNYIHNHKKEILPWGSITLEKYLNELKFDAFWGDTDDYKFTKFTYESGLYSTINSLVKNALIGGVSFACVMPAHNNAKSRVWVRNSSNTTIEKKDGKVEYGVTVFNDNKIFDDDNYVFYGKDYTLLLNNQGDVIQILEEHNYGIPQIVPFTVNNDTSKKGLGRSVFSQSFEKSLESALENLILTKNINFHNARNKNILVAKAIDSDYIDQRTQKTEKSIKDDEKLSETPTVYLPNLSSELEHIKLDSGTTSEISEAFMSNATHAAGSVFLTLSDFGYTLINGSSLSSESLESMEKKFISRIEQFQSEIAPSIKSLVILLYLRANNKLDDGIFDLSPGFVYSVREGDLVGLGDAILKLSQVGLSLSKRQAYKILGQRLFDDIYGKSDVLLFNSREENNNNI